MYITADLDVPSASGYFGVDARRGVSTDLYGRLELEENGLRDENLTSLGAQVSNLGLQQLDLLAGPAAADFQQPVYDGIEIHLVFCHSCDLLRALM